jgi:hypothetical protein
MVSPHSSDSQIRAVVIAADRRRRARDARGELARLAPMAAGVCLATALVGRLLGWPSAVALVVVAAAAAGLLVRFVLQSRPRPASDAVASRVDADASLAGELRSAHWFATRDARDAWADYHVDQAAGRAAAVDWSGLYPPAAVGRAWAGTAVLTAAAVALVLVGGTPARQPAAAGLSAADLAELKAELPADMQLRLDQLLTAMGESDLPIDGQRLTPEEVQAMLAQLDPELQQKLAELAEQRGLDESGEAGRDLSEQELSEMVENSSAGLPEDVRWALEDLAARLANSSAERETNPENQSASSESGEAGLGSEQAEAEQSSAASEGGMQMMRQAASEGGDSQMMMAGAGAMGGDSAGGEGGNSGTGAGEGEFESIAQALRQELVEASQDVRGDNVQPDEQEEVRRKTEQGDSSLGFTRVAPATFDRSRAVGPPAVPDARRPLLFNYFIRRQ